MTVSRNIPIEFTVKNTYNVEDTRFVEVSIKLMHTESNFNGSYFSKDVVEAALPSLANTPILAYIEDNENGEIDFSDHRQVLVKEDGQYKIKYIGQAIGVIPETNNARFEKHTTESGVEREYVVVDGLLWTKWDDPIEIMQRDTQHQQSMEIHENYQGRFEDDNLFHFTYFQFFGACALSNIGLLPAMEEASIELKFSMENFQKEIQTKMERFKQFAKIQSSNEVDINMQEGGKESLKDKLELLAKYNLTVETLSFSIDELSIEDLESKIKEQFSLSNSQLMVEIDKILQTMTEMKKNYWGELVEKRSFYLMDIKDENAIVVTNDWDTYYGIPYSVNGDIVTLDFEAKVEYIPDWRPKQAGDTTTFTSVSEVITSEFEKIKEETEAKVTEATEKFTTLETEKAEIQTQLETIITEFEQVKPELTRLQEFEATTLSTLRTEQEQELFSQYEEKLANVEEFETLKTNSANYTIENLEKELALLFVKKTANFSFKENKKSTVKISVNHNEDSSEDEIYGGLHKKYLKK